MQNLIIMNQISYNLDGVLQDCWHRLINATHKVKHPFHNPTIATVNNAVPELRTVVLRKVIQKENSLVFYTDYRSPKINQIKKCNIISWLFYDPKTKLQLRIKTMATIHNQDEIAKKNWDNSRVESRKCYLTHSAPSTITTIATDGIPEILRDIKLTNDNTNNSFIHFAVIENKVIEIDWLLFGHDGHRRAKFFIGDHANQQTWIIP